MQDFTLCAFLQNFICFIYAYIQKITFCTTIRKKLSLSSCKIGILLTKVRKPPVHMTDAHLGENPLFVDLRRLLSELRTKLARFACSNSGSPFWRYARPLTDFQTNAYSVMRTGGFLRYWHLKIKRPVNTIIPPNQTRPIAEIDLGGIFI